MRSNMLVALTSLTLLLAGCGSHPPTLSAQVDGVGVPAVLSSHCWKSCADYPLPEDHLRAEGYKPPVVKAESSLKLAFSTAPQEWSLDRWQGGKLQHVGTQRGMPQSILMPTKAGVYTYAISGDWTKGSAMYIFQVEIEE